MNRIKIAVLVLIAALALTGCAPKTETVKIGIVGEESDMWTPVIEKLKKENIDIELVAFTDYNLPNAALADGDIDLNAFQHYAYFNNECETMGYDLIAIGETYISPTCIYSEKVENVSEIGAGAVIALAGDVTNQGRALKVLEAAGLIELDPSAGYNASVRDITKNPLNIEILETDASQLCAILPDVDAAVINSNYAVDNGFVPGEDSIFMDAQSLEGGSNPYVNIIAARAVDKDNEVYKKIVAAYQSDEVIKVYDTVYNGSYYPCWKK